MVSMERPGRLTVRGFMDFVNTVETGENSLAIFWLGQAGFLFKTPDGRLIAVDPYLSDCCERIAGFRRITPSVMPLEEFRADWLFVSHEHPDHFDVDLIARWKGGAEAGIYGAVSCLGLAAAAGVPADRFTVLEEGGLVQFPGFSVLSVKADHGALSPDALGFVFDFGFVRVYFSGDTAYSPGLLKQVMKIRPEIALLPINGEYGNLNAREAAQLSRDVGAKVLIPCHYWTFIEHGSSPLELKMTMEETMPGITPVFLAQGGCCIHRKQSAR